MRFMKTALALAACGAATTVYAQSNVTLFGLIDTNIRYSTNDNAAGDNRLQMANEGFLTGNRWGMRGTEDLGGGNQAIFMLESGFGPDNGALQQGGRLFGRQAYVGLKTNFGGQLTMGRQYTIAGEFIPQYEASGLAINPSVGYQSFNYDGLRHDNMIRYGQDFGGGLKGAVGYTFGEVAGHMGRNSAVGANLSYTNGPLMLGGVFQTTRDVSGAAYFNALATGQTSRQTVWSVGGTYNFGVAKVFAGYINNELKQADYRNHDFFVGLHYDLTAALKFIGSLHYDRLRHAGNNGNRVTSMAMLDYNFSKRTDVYFAVDYTKLSGEWITLNGNPRFNSTANTNGFNNKLGLTAGLRHRF